ncbi:MAG: hypothetical protein ACKVU4_03770 [Phycisphaerales bacterium]
MRVCFLAPLIPLLVLAGCSIGPREYRYDIDLINRTDRPVTVELLRAQGHTLGKVRVDLAAGGAYVSSYTTHGTEYLEARVQFLYDAEPDRYYLRELGDGLTQRDIVIEKGAPALVRRYDPGEG